MWVAERISRDQLTGTADRRRSEFKVRVDRMGLVRPARIVYHRMQLFSVIAGAMMYMGEMAPNQTQIQIAGT